MIAISDPAEHQLVINLAIAGVIFLAALLFCVLYQCYLNRKAGRQ